MEAAILAVVALVGSLVLALWRHMDGRFNRIEERFDRRFDRLDDKVVGHGERIAHMEGVQAASTVHATGPAPAATPSGAVPAEA